MSAAAGLRGALLLPAGPAPGRGHTATAAAGPRGTRGSQAPRAAGPHSPAELLGGCCYRGRHHPRHSWQHAATEAHPGHRKAVHLRQLRGPGPAWSGMRQQTSHPKDGRVLHPGSPSGGLPHRMGDPPCCRCSLHLHDGLEDPPCGGPSNCCSAPRQSKDS